MNFFGNWSRTKVSNGNKKYEDVTSESGVVSEGTTLNTAKLFVEGAGSNSRTYYKTKNRRKNNMFTRSLWYDSIRHDEVIDTNLKKAQSFDNLESTSEEEYSSEDIIIMQPNLKTRINESLSPNTLKKSYSLDNLDQKGTRKGKIKLVVTKEMISHPIAVRKITKDDKHFPMNMAFEKIIEENGEIREKDTLLEHLKYNDTQVEHEKIELYNDPKDSDNNRVRKFASLGNLLIDNEFNPPQGKCASTLVPETKFYSKEMISNPIEIQQSKCNGTEIDQEQSKPTFFNVKYSDGKKLRRSLSLDSYLPRVNILNRPRKNSCSSIFPKTKFLYVKGLNKTISSFNSDDSHSCQGEEIFSLSQLDLAFDNSKHEDFNNLKKITETSTRAEPTKPSVVGDLKEYFNSFEVNTITNSNRLELFEHKKIEVNCENSDEKTIGDDVDGGTLGKHAVQNEVIIRNKAQETDYIVKEDLFKTTSVSHKEVLKTLQLSREDPGAQYYPPQKFPLTDDGEGIQFRRNQIAQYRCSKTTDFDFGRRLYGSINDYPDFDVRGCVKIQLPHESICKLKKNEILKYQNGNIYRCTENNRMETYLLYNNVKLKSARLLNKREVELRDDNNIIFILIFDSSKDAKAFLESEKLNSYIADDQKSSVKKTLFRLLGKRSSREVLEKKGIYQNEPIFGNTLKNIYNVDRGIPKFILKTIELIEKPGNITSLGIYRTSGNLATIQKIRFEVDKGRLEILDDFSKDVDVLTGSLKLFFRELKEPLISCDACDQLLNLTKTDKSYSKKDKEKIRSVLNHLPEANWETLRVLLRHLTEVAKYKEQNKMDTYNLSVCWGPTVMFATESIDSSNYKDLVTQSAEATRMFESLLLFFLNNPEELNIGNKKQDSLDRNRNRIFRQESKESIHSSDSNASKGTVKRTGSNLICSEVDDVIRKMVELIDLNLTVEGIYKKSGAMDKVSKITKKVTKKKLVELEKYKNDGLELCTSFKTYLQGQEPLVIRQVVEQIIRYCDNAHCLEQNTRQKVLLALHDLPKKDSFTFLLKHIITVLEHEPFHKVPRSEMISIWVNVLNQKRIVDTDFTNFLRIALEAFDEKKADIIGSPRGMTNGLLNDLKNHHKERDRTSKYDNVPDESEMRHETALSEEKTDHIEHTKL